MNKMNTDHFKNGKSALSACIIRVHPWFPFNPPQGGSMAYRSYALSVFIRVYPWFVFYPPQGG